MKLVIAVIITTISPRYPISEPKKDVKFKAKPSRIIAKGIIILIIHFPPFSMLGTRFADNAPKISAKVLAPILMSKSIKTLFIE